MTVGVIKHTFNANSASGDLLDYGIRGVTTIFGNDQTLPFHTPRWAGEGPARMCMVSQTFFPESRWKRRWDGRVVGDVFWFPDPKPPH